MSDMAQIRVICSEPDFDMAIYMHRQGEDVEQVVAEALERVKGYKPHDPYSIMVFMVGRLIEHTGREESLYLGPGPWNDMYRTVTIDCKTQTVTYESIYGFATDPDRPAEGFDAFIQRIRERVPASA